jgi:hypothetical protein
LLLLLEPELEPEELDFDEPEELEPEELDFDEPEELELEELELEELELEELDELEELELEELLLLLEPEELLLLEPEELPFFLLSSLPFLDFFFLLDFFLLDFFLLLASSCCSPSRVSLKGLELALSGASVLAFWTAMAGTEGKAVAVARIRATAKRRAIQRTREWEFMCLGVDGS